MGVQDRDWYWKDREAKERAARQQPEEAPAQPRQRNRSHQPPALIGSNWHWSLKLLVWLCIAVLMLAAWRLIR